MWCGSAQANVFRRGKGFYLFFKHEYVADSYLQHLQGRKRSEKLELIPVLIGLGGDFCNVMQDHSASAEAYRTTEGERAGLLIRIKNGPNHWKDTAACEALHVGESRLSFLISVWKGSRCWGFESVDFERYRVFTMQL
jgi:hypothetical protein